MVGLTYYFKGCLLRLLQIRDHNSKQNGERGVGRRTETRSYRFEEAGTRSGQLRIGFWGILRYIYNKQP